MEANSYSDYNKA